MFQLTPFKHEIKSEDKEFIDDSANFVAWLLNKNPKDIIGFRACSDCCPIYTYFQYLFPEHTFLVNPAHVVIFDDGYQVVNYYPTPDWMEIFIELVDTRNTTRNVTAYQSYEHMIDAIYFDKNNFFVALWISFWMHIKKYLFKWKRL